MQLTANTVKAHLSVRWMNTLMVCLLLATMGETSVQAKEIDFTRYLDKLSVRMSSRGFSVDSLNRSSPSGTPATFKAQTGSARLFISAANPAGNFRNTRLEILLNGETLPLSGLAIGLEAVEVPVELTLDNHIDVRLVPWKFPAAEIQPHPTSDENLASISDRVFNYSLEVRIKQRAEVQLHVQSRVHFNTNVSDFAAAREFYGKLGFKTLSGFPDTNTQAMAQAIGIKTPTDYDGALGDEAGGYLLHGELIGVGGFSGGLIDLIEFTIPRNDTPPYPNLNRLGMAKAIMHTRSLERDYALMRKQGVEFISPPAIRSNGSRFAIFKDLDGTFYELLQLPGKQDVSGADDEAEIQIVGLGQVAINVSDFERSSAWYEMLGFNAAIPKISHESLAVGRALGFDQAISVTHGLITHPQDDSTLEILQWRDPFDATPAYPLPVNHLGIHRMAFATSDIEADVAALKAQGVVFVSDITPCCSGDDSPGSIVAFYDPDGVIVELVEQPFMTEMMSILGWIRSTFF